MRHPIAAPVRPLRPDYDYFRARLRPHHLGIDVYPLDPVPGRAPAVAVIGGAVHRVGWLNDLAGWGIEIISADRRTLVRYLHLHDAPDWKVGALVKVGDVLGRVGRSGNANATHLHFEVRVDVAYWPNIPGTSLGRPIDPLPLLSQSPSPGGDGSMFAKRGDRNRIVETWQHWLKAQGADLGTFGPNRDGIDGAYGAKTAAAVARFMGGDGSEIGPAQIAKALR